MFLTFILFIPLLASAQDERSFNRVFRGMYGARQEHIRDFPYKWKVDTPMYNIDFNRDGLQEKFYVSKRDMEDWLTVLNINNHKIFEYQFMPKGHDATAYKIVAKYLSKKYRVFIIYYYEGHTEHVKLNSSTRLYFLTIDRGDLHSLKMFAGPRIWVESYEFPDHYRRREYRVDVHDYNNDGQKDISIKFGTINRIYNYLGSGRWKKN